MFHLPTEEIPLSLFGFMAGSIEIVGGIVQSIDEEWDVANQGKCLLNAMP